MLEATKADIGSPMPSFLLKVLDSTFTSEFVAGVVKGVPGAVVEGCILSNTGNYPGETDIAFAGCAAADSGVALTASYCICGLNQPAFELVQWYQTVNGKPTYSASHKLDKAFGERLIKNAVAVYEAIGTIGEDESIGAVADRLLGAQY